MLAPCKDPAETIVAMIGQLAVLPREEALARVREVVAKHEQAPHSDLERARQGLPPYNPSMPTEQDWQRITENGRKAWGGAQPTASAETDREQLMRAIVTAGQSAGIIRSDLETVSVSECLHILECLSKPAASAEPVAVVEENPHCPEGLSDEISEYLPTGMKLYAAPVAAQAQPDYPGATVADRLDAMADDCAPGSQRAADLRAAATVWRKHLAGPAAQPKRRPYNASGSLSEYGVFPECDAQQPADDEVVFIDGVGAGRSSIKSCRDGVQWIMVGDRVYWPLSDSDAKRLQSACCGNGSFDGPASPAGEGDESMTEQQPVAQCTNETALALADAPRSLRNYVAALQAENERLLAERDELAKDAARMDWFFGSIDKSDFIPTYMQGMREKWTPDQWRAAIDAAQAQPKRRPYNASGSLSEHGIPPECDAAPVAQDPAKGVDVALRYNWNEHLIEHNAPEYQHDFMLFKVVEAYVLKHLADRQQRGGDVVSAFDAAVAAELPKVSTLEYNSHEICKHFAERVRAALAAQPATHPDDVAVDRFAAAMKAKLAKKRAEGRNGWDDKAQCSQELLSRLLSEHVEKGDPVDVGNFAMMLHQRGEKITAQAPTANADARDAARWRTAVKNWRVKNVEIFDGVTLTNRSGIHWDDLIRQVDAARAAGGDQ